MCDGLVYGLPSSTVPYYCIAHVLVSIYSQIQHVSWASIKESPSHGQRTLCSEHPSLSLTIPGPICGYQYYLSSPYNCTSMTIASALSWQGWPGCQYWARYCHLAGKELLRACRLLPLSTPLSIKMKSTL